jgi:hypothetical protein
MADFTTLPGDPGLVSRDATRYESLSHVILAAAQRLNALVDDTQTIGESVDAVRGKGAEVSGSIMSAHPRYRETALALQDYSVQLRDAQDRAAAAISAAEKESDELPPLQRRQHDLETDHARAILAPRSPDEVDDIEREQRHIAARLQEVQSQLSVAASSWESAADDVDRAAAVAIARIRPALDRLNDSLLDRIGAVLDDVGGFLAAVAEWVAKFLTDIVFAIIVIAVALVALVIVLTLVLSIVGFVVAILFLTGAIDVGDLQAMLDVLVSTLLVLLPILVPVIYLLLAREWLTPTPPMKETTPVIGDEHARAIVKDDDGSTRTVGDYEDAFTTNGIVDSDGGTAETEVSIIQVMNADGTPRLDAAGNPIWRVTLPSTQNWQLSDGGDTGAMNDLGSNLALMLSPQQQAAYERAVIEAMHNAGIGPNDPVMLVGFSQGGILAGKLASTDPQPFNIDAIVVGGAPIDAMPIPSTVQVLSFQHPDDPVHQLDGATHQDTTNWVTIRDSTEPGQAAHGATSYSLTAKHVDDGPNDPVTQAIIDKQDEFFSDYEIEHKYVGAE